MQTDGGVQAAGWSPRSIANARDEFSRSFRSDERDANTVDGKSEVWRMESGDVHLQAFNGRIHIAGGATAAWFFTKHIPRFECLANIDMDAGGLELSDAGAAEFEVWCKPVVIDAETGLLQPCGDLTQVVPEEVR